MIHTCMRAVAPAAAAPLFRPLPRPAAALALFSALWTHNTHALHRAPTHTPLCTPPPPRSDMLALRSASRRLRCGAVRAALWPTQEACVASQEGAAPSQGRRAYAAQGRHAEEQSTMVAKPSRPPPVLVRSPRRQASIPKRGSAAGL